MKLQVDAGQLRLQIRLPSGTRLEETAAKLSEIQREIRSIIPPAELQTVYEQIGVLDAVNLALAAMDLPAKHVYADAFYPSAV